MCTLFQLYHHPLGEDHFIDAQYEESSNWLRWVNSARWNEEQNMFETEDRNGIIYYLLYKDVAAGQELLSALSFWRNEYFY